jgi:hypothetical protein
MAWDLGLFGLTVAQHLAALQVGARRMRRRQTVLSWRQRRMGHLISALHSTFWSSGPAFQTQLGGWCSTQSDSARCDEAFPDMLQSNRIFNFVRKWVGSNELSHACSSLSAWASGKPKPRGQRRKTAMTAMTAMTLLARLHVEDCTPLQSIR